VGLMKDEESWKVDENLGNKVGGGEPGGRFYASWHSSLENKFSYIVNSLEQYNHLNASHYHALLIPCHSLSRRPRKPDCSSKATTATTLRMELSFVTYGIAFVS